MEENKEKTNDKSMVTGFIVTIAAIVVVALVGVLFLQPKDPYIQGQADADQVRISSKVPGRIESLLVEEGQCVRQGDTLGRLYIPDIEAKKAQAAAALSAAQAQSKKAQKGARSEQITAAYQVWQKAVAGLEIAEKSYRRMENLFGEGVVTAQKRDEALANYKAMQASERAARSQYDMAVNGAEREDREAASALVERAQGAMSEIESYIDESILISPIDGEVSDIFPLEGELVGTGAPIMNILDMENLWVSFNVREDELGALKMGQEISARIPALDDQTVTLKVTYLKDLGSYATWKATKTNGQYDIKTFEVRARPTAPIEGLRPGMTVLLERKSLK